MSLPPGLQRILAFGLVAALVASIVGIVVLAAIGKPQPVELLGLPAALIVAISSGQIFLGHQAVTTAQAAATADVIQTLSSQLAGAVQNAAGGSPPTTMAPTAEPATSPSPDPTSGSGSSASDERATSPGRFAAPGAPSPPP